MPERLGDGMGSTREAQRKVRIATGAMCRCRKCYCCEEWLKAIAKQRAEYTARRARNTLSQAAPGSCQARAARRRLRAALTAYPCLATDCDRWAHGVSDLVPASTKETT